MILATHNFIFMGYYMIQIITTTCSSSSMDDTICVVLEPAARIGDNVSSKSNK